jgi:hypothetical protein
MPASPPSQQPMHRTVLNLTEAQYEWLRYRSYVERVTMTEVLRRLIDSARADDPDRGVPPPT